MRHYTCNFGQRVVMKDETSSKHETAESKVTTDRRSKRGKLLSACAATPGVSSGGKHALFRIDYIDNRRHVQPIVESKLVQIVWSWTSKRFSCTHCPQVVDI